MPIVLPGGKKRSTLHEARQHLLSLPKSRHQDLAVAAAIEALLMAAEERGPMMHANVGIARVVYGPPKIPELQQRSKKTLGTP